MEDSSFLGNIGSLFQSTDSGQRLAGGAEGLAGGVSSLSQSAFDSAVTQPVQAASDLVSQVTGGNVNLSSPALPEGAVASAQETTGSPVTTVDQFNAFMKGLNEEAAAQQPSTPGATTGAVQPATQPATASGSQIPKFGEDGYKFAERGSPQDFFLAQTNEGTQALSQEQIARGQAYAQQQGMNFDPTTGFSSAAPTDPQAPAPQQGGNFGLAGFTPQFEGQTPSQFMRGEDTAADTTFQGTDFQGRLQQFASPEARQANIEEGQASFVQASADREARQAARPDFGAAISDRDRRAASGEGISTADRKDMAKANMRGASASDIARGNKIADELGVDLKTGESLTTGTTAKDIAETDKIKAEILSILSEVGNKGTELNLSPAELARDKAAGGTLNKWNDSGRSTIQSNINTLNEVITGLEDSNIKTRGFIDALPFGADWARAIMNPTGADAKDRVQGVIFQTLKETLGAQFTEKEGKRLVEASYNSMLSPEANAARLRDYTAGLMKASEARESQMRYLQENKTLAGYQGPSPAGVMSQVGSGGAGGSPIKGDVDDKSLDGALL